MHSWTLLHHLLPDESAPTSPVFLRETIRPPAWKHTLEQATRFGVRFVALMLLLYFLPCRSGTAQALVNLSVVCLAAPLFLLMPSLLFLALPLGLTLGPSIAAEREKLTWETLRSTPLPLPVVVWGKAGGALWWLQDRIRNTSSMLVPVAFFIGLASLLLTVAHDAGSAPPLVTWTLAAAPSGLIALAFLADRAQEFVLMAVAALSISAASRATRMAVPGATVAALLAWLADLGLGGIALLALPGERLWSAVLHALLLILFGPVPCYVVEFPAGQALLLAAATLAIREGGVYLLWRWTLHAARTV